MCLKSVTVAWYCRAVVATTRWVRRDQLSLLRSKLCAMCSDQVEHSQQQCGNGQAAFPSRLHLRCHCGNANWIRRVTRPILGLLVSTLLVFSSACTAGGLSQSVKPCTSEALDFAPGLRAFSGTGYLSIRTAFDNDHYSDRRVLNSTSAPADLIGYYANSIRDAGIWKLAEKGGDDILQWSSWKALDKCGRTWYGLLTISATPEMGWPVLSWFSTIDRPMN